MADNQAGFLEGAQFSPNPQTDWGAIVRTGHGVVNFGNPSAQVVNFYWNAVPHAGKSREAGRPMYERKIFVTVNEPGDRLQQVNREIEESDKQRWPMQWRAFLENRAQVPEGTPIDNLFPVNPDISGTLRGWGVHTVEQLANLSAHGIDSIGMGAQGWVNSAQTYLARAAKGVGHHEIETLKQAHEHEKRTLQAQVTQLVGQVEKLTAIVQGTNPGYVAAQLAQASVAFNPPSTPQVPLKPVPEAKPWEEAPQGFFNPEGAEPVKPKPRGGWPKGKPRTPKGDTPNGE